jgi:hypothetical protein
MTVASSIHSIGAQNLGITIFQGNGLISRTIRGALDFAALSFSCCGQHLDEAQCLRREKLNISIKAKYGSVAIGFAADEVRDHAPSDG